MKLIFYSFKLEVKEYLGVGGGDYEIVVQEFHNWLCEYKKL